jgi:hypothetical protein
VQIERQPALQMMINKSTGSTTYRISGGAGAGSSPLWDFRFIQDFS